MATAIKLRSNIRKLKKAIDTKGISSSVKDKLKSQLEKAEKELASYKKSGKAPKSSVVKSGASSLSKLQKLIQKKKYAIYQGQGVDLEKDAEKPALRSGKRKSKSGKTYYEYRANRIDVKQPPKTRPRLEKGGYMARGGKLEVGDMVMVDDSGYVKLFSGFDTTKPAKIISKGKTKSSGKVVYFYGLEMADGRKPFNNAPEYKLTKVSEKGGMMADGGEIIDPEELYKKLSNAESKFNEDGGAEYRRVKQQISENRKRYFDRLGKSESKWSEDGGAEYKSLMKMRDKFMKGGYMADGGKVSKVYEKIEGTDYELKIQVYYDKGGMNYFTSRPEARGYYLSVSPVQVERRENGIMVESYAAFSGIKALVLPVQRQSPKAEKQAEELAVKMMPELKEQVTSNLKRKLGLMAEGGVMETRDILTEEQQMAKGGQINDLLSKQSEFLAQLTDIKLEADLETEEGVLNYRNQISPIRVKLAAIENELEELGYEAYEKGGYMAKGGMTLGDISKKYDENEDINYHTENVVLLATHFGTESELRDAKTIKAKHDAIGHLPFNLYQERNELGEKLYERMQEQIRENGMGAKPKKVVAMAAKEYENPKYMAKGGEMHRYEKGGYMAKGGGIKNEIPKSKIIEYVKNSFENNKLSRAERTNIKKDKFFSKADGKEYYRLTVNGDVYFYDTIAKRDDQFNMVVKLTQGNYNDAKNWLEKNDYAKGGYMADGGVAKRKFVKGDMVYIISDEQPFENYFAEVVEVGEKFSKVEDEEGEVHTVYNTQIQIEGDNMAKGGATEHGLKMGDKIVADQFWENTVVVENPKTGRAVVDLESGKRKEASK